MGPQEVCLLGSRRLNSTLNETGCVFLGSYRHQVNDTIAWLTPNRYPFWNNSYMCGKDKVYGWEDGEIKVWMNDTAKALPSNTYLICGDRAW